MYACTRQIVLIPRVFRGIFMTTIPAKRERIIGYANIHVAIFYESLCAVRKTLYF